MLLPVALGDNITDSASGFERLLSIITSNKTRSEYDVIVVGSGAAGGTSAYVLAMEGIKVLMLEAGRNYDPLTETPMFQTPDQAPLRGAKTPDKPDGFYDATVDGGYRVPGEPYTSAEDTDFRWWRARMLGGRTNHWGRISLRMGPYDFKPHSRDGLGIDWPIDYDDLAPWYDKTEAMVGICGSNEGLENTPDSSPGILQPAPRARAYELLTKEYCKELGIPVVPCHRAVMSTTQDGARIAKLCHPNNQRAQALLAQHLNSRAACFWATPCKRGCSIRANYQSTTVHIPPALASGNLDIVCDSMVREVAVDASGQATGVHYVDKQTRTDQRAKARVVILCASGCESARILLNSKSPQFPDGLANSSGLVGKYLMDTVGADLRGQIPALENLPRANEDGNTGLHMYMPWWLYPQQIAGELDFARGYHIEFRGGQQMPGTGTFGSIPGLTDGAFGKRLKEEVRRYYGSFIGFSGRGEMIPNTDSYCDIDPDEVDEYGIPVLRFHWKWSEHELNQAAHMHRTFKEIIEAMGGTVASEFNGSDGSKAIKKPGEIKHEVGTTCMGSDPQESVLNQYCQSWDVKNLFVTDGGCFASNADKNPTLSIMAIAWRSCDYLAQELRKGNI
jgi:choline dehydrogenase-like flavoprotein